MQYITIKGISAQGIPKVYVTGHSAGFEKYLHEIADDLLKFSNCAVFYDPTPEQPESMETFFDDLESMQLVVLVVTADFVEQDTFAFSHVFKFAQDHTIPVLPIQEDSDIEEAFNKKCGDLQMLNRNSHDRTQISYEYKLKQYLDSVLIGDEMIEKIRAAFDAYVFLSYRKKDREYAQKLMRLIHSNDFCRDIAIWYDEFLVPGENFNEAIEEAMKKSELFALAVTPNLLEDNNYVMTTEYPEAARSQKPVMPVELVETDKQALQEKYKDIPSPISAGDPKCIAETVRQALGLESTENNDPQHLFFIGLAYLSGIDVEVDRERAVKMITAAAEQDLPEAISKLASLYHEGEGVERDFPNAIKWQKRLVQLREEQYKKTGAESDARQWMLDYRQWASDTTQTWDYWEIIYANWWDALELYKKELTVLEELMKRFSDDWFENHLFKTLLDISFSYLQLNKTQESIEWSEKAFKVKEKLPDHIGTAEEYRELYSIYNFSGDFWRKHLEDLPMAIMWYERAAEATEKLAATEDVDKANDRFYYLYSDIGDFHEKNGDISNARVWYEKVVTVREKEAEEKNSEMSFFTLSETYVKLYVFCHKLGDNDAAKVYFEKAVATDKLIEKKHFEKFITRCFRHADDCDRQGDIAGAKEWIESLDMTYGSLGKEFLQSKAILREKGSTLEDIAKTENSDTSHLNDDFKTAYEIGIICVRKGYIWAAESWFDKAPKKLSKKDDEREYAQKAVSLCYRLVGNAQMYYKKYKKYDHAEEWYKIALKYLEKPAKHYDPDDIQRDIAVCYSDLGDVSKKQQDYFTAEGRYEKALAILERLAEHDDSDETQKNIAVCYSDLGDICQKQEDYITAKDRYEKAIAILEKLAGPDDPDAMLKVLADCYRDLGDICQKQEDYAYAVELYKKEIPIREKLAEHEDPYINKVALDLCCSSFCLCFTSLLIRFVEQGDLAAAKNCYKKEIAIIENPAIKNKRLYINVLKLLGSICKETKDYGEAKICFEKAIAILEKKAEHDDPDENLKDLADCYRDLGSICKETKDYGEAKICFEKAIAILEKKAEHDDHGDNLKKLADCYRDLGGICQEQKDYAYAVELYKKEIPIREKLAEHEGSNINKVALDLCCNSFCICFTGLIVSFLEQGDIAAVKSCFEKEIAILEKPAIKNDPLFIRVLELLNSICTASGDIAASEKSDDGNKNTSANDDE